MFIFTAKEILLITELDITVINIEAHDKTATHWAARGTPLHYIAKQLQKRAFRGFPLCHITRQQSR